MGRVSGRRGPRLHERRRHDIVFDITEVGKKYGAKDVL